MYRRSTGSDGKRRNCDGEFDWMRYASEISRFQKTREWNAIDFGGDGDVRMWQEWRRVETVHVLCTQSKEERMKECQSRRRTWSHNICCIVCKVVQTVISI